jgi:ribonuclease VapC
MVIDSSAVLAIVFGEPDAKAMAEAIDRAESRWMSSATALEAYVASVASRGEAAANNLDMVLLRARIEIVPFTEEHLSIARRAFRAFGKGRHPAGLNFGDCFSYALSKASGEPLLFKGADFAKTDVEVAPLPAA